MNQYPLNRPLGAQISSAITTNATTVVNTGSNAVFSGLLVGTAGSAWNAAIYNGNPASGGVLLATLSADAVGPVVSPPLACPNGLYVVTSGTTAGSIQIAYEPVWTAAVYNGNPASSGTLLTTISSSKPGSLPSPLLACPQGLYVETSNITSGSLNVCYYA